MSTSDIDLARAALQDSAINLRGELAKNYNVRFFSFDETLQPPPLQTRLWSRLSMPLGEHANCGPPFLLGNSA